jgi:hypothetical protein
MDCLSRTQGGRSVVKSATWCVDVEERRKKTRVLEQKCFPYCILEYGWLSDTDSLFTLSGLIIFLELYLQASFHQIWLVEAHPAFIVFVYTRIGEKGNPTRFFSCTFIRIPVSLRISHIYEKEIMHSASPHSVNKEYYTSDSYVIVTREKYASSSDIQWYLNQTSYNIILFLSHKAFSAKLSALHSRKTCAQTHTHTRTNTHTSTQKLKMLSTSPIRVCISKCDLENKHYIKKTMTHNVHIYVKNIFMIRKQHIIFLNYGHGKRRWNLKFGTATL